MSSHNRGRAHVSPSDPFSNFSEVSQSSSTNTGNAYAPRYPRSQLARPVNYTHPRNRASSLSAAEETTSIVAPSAASSRPTSRANRLSMLPRPSTGGYSAPSAVPSVSPQNPFSISTPDVATPPAFLPPVQEAPLKRPRNVLRRKAATIGKNMEQDQSQKLSLIIPEAAQSSQTRDQRWPQSLESTEPPPAMHSTRNQSNSVIAETPKTNGPVELASLRTTIDTQNLPPPPTPFFPSANTPSTRYSESPGIWSRGSTPTSLSSYSPGLVHTSKIGRLRHPSPSSTRLPVFTPPTAYPSPQSASSDRSEIKPQRSALPTRSNKQSPGTGGGNQTQLDKKSPHTAIQALPHSPPPRKSSVNFSPPKRSPESDSSNIDVEKARKEVEEAELELFNSQKCFNATPKIQSPPRPSRDGTHRLDLESSPVVRSNLPFLRSTGHTRRESAERINAASRPTPTRRPSASPSLDSTGSKDLSRTSSREASSPVLAFKSSKSLTKVASPSTEKTDSQKTGTSKRFGFFQKKSKPHLGSSSGDQSRPARKGPAAGTGHEGYGKYVQRGRKSSTSSSGARTRSNSTTRSAPRSISSSKGSISSRPDLDLDDFLSSRLEPVVISGGGMDEASLSRTQSEQSISSLSVASSIQPRQTPLTSSNVHSTESLAASTGQVGEPEPREPGVGLSLTPGNVSQRAPETTNRHAAKSRMPIAKSKTQSIYANSAATVTRTSLPHSETSSVPVHKPKDAPGSSSKQAPAAEQREQPIKKGKSSRWNLFQRKRANEPKKAPPAAPAPTPDDTQLHAAISRVQNSRQVAHYALVNADSDELDDILNHVEDSPLTEEEDEQDEPLVLPAVPAGLNIKKRRPSVLLPSPPQMPSEFRNDRSSPKTAMFNRNMTGLEPGSSPEDRRPRRLASIGRIPQVISRRDRQHIPNRQSFSRPFSVVESPAVQAPVLDESKETVNSIDSPDGAAGTPTTQSMEWGLGLTPTFSAAETVSALNFLSGPYSSDQFLHFSPRKDSISSSSSGALPAGTAVAIPPDTEPTEDEVWNEYDDLIDHVLSPEPESNDTGFEGNDRFELATMASRALQDELSSDSLRAGAFNPAGDLSRDSSDSVRLRRSRIVSALNSPIAPSAPTSFSDLESSRPRSDESSKRPATPVHPCSTPFQEQQPSFLQSLATVPVSKSKRSDGRKEIHSSSERDWDAVTRTNMRSASLMTSRWLSFGRVLFSPAHNHVKTGSHGRILLVDGLGNDDWSFYCSLNYPDAEVYNLSGRPVSTALPHPAAWQPPTNHHTVYHAGLHNPLPFPKDYFTAAVLRFPAASSEHVQANIIQECKRVLRPGGYLEMSLLDRDMVNMGVRTRKAVRRLKEMTCLANPSITLKPTSDSVQRLLGTQGFDNLRRCVVRIPVTGVIVRSSDSTTSSSNRSLSATTPTPSTAFSLPTISITTATGSQTTRPLSTSPPFDDNVSLGDLLSDPSPSATNDERIAKIVARVGRWWYTKCYEDPVLPNTGDNNLSLWNERKVLRECQKRGTGFRMLIAYAQKPSEVKRRTASV